MIIFQKRALLSIYFLIITTSFINNSSQKDLVPNEETAIKIADAIWLPIYGKEIYLHKPFKAKLTNENIWVVEGSDIVTDSINIDLTGGNPYIEINKKDCRILKVKHGK